jgi:AraC family transcriptional regulator of adaptative response / DNA-3-methyladenine glycosylase II
MLSALMTSDATFNGRFVTGVLSTGIYCLPGCRARKPKPENVRFFENFASARAAGLRACRKCKPDLFERGESHAELDRFEGALRSLREDPAAFPKVETLAQALGVGETKLFALARRFTHRTPAALLAQARIDRAKELLRTSEATVAEVAFAVGFESVSAFYSHFQEQTGLNPTGYRSLRGVRDIALRLTEPYDAGGLLRYAGRDPESLSERAEGSTAWFGVWLGECPSALRLSFGRDGVELSWSDGNGFDAHQVATRLLGLDQDVCSFLAHIRRMGHSALVEGHEGARIPQTATEFDAMVWSIVGQQVTVGFAATLRRRLVERWGVPASQGLRAPLRPEDLAHLDESDLTAQQFSRRKAEYLLALSRQPPNLTGLSAPRAEATLLATRGFGPWATHYVMMRGLGFGDCVPLGDTGLRSALSRYLRRPVDPKEVAVLMEPFSPHRTLATLHLWLSLSKEA